MGNYTAWVITWSRLSSAVNGNMPDTPIRAPLALLPGRSAHERVEGALVALHQMLCGSTPSDMVGALRRMRPYEVEWDYLRVNARLGHDPEVLAFHSSVRHSTRTRDPETGEGRLLYRHPRWTTRAELRELARDFVDAQQMDEFAAVAAAEAALRDRVTDWRG